LQQGGPLEDEAWYHGALPRQETEELLKQEGDFIVRFKSDASGQYVLSCRSADKQRHFPIVKQDDSTYRLEGGSFRSIQELVNHHMSTQTPVTKAMMIRNPISKVKDEHDLRHKDILLDTKLGQRHEQNVTCKQQRVNFFRWQHAVWGESSLPLMGHFGDVHKATFKNKPVAVKTCKATVCHSSRAYILKNYNHPNIVKLIGVATDRHPIYIVMELVQGGDLLKLLRDDSKTLSVPEKIKMSEDAARDGLLGGQKLYSQIEPHHHHATPPSPPHTIDLLSIYTNVRIKHSVELK
ncbi:putative tyrosine-protein kinase, partial [Apostichopus japonicus]